MNGITARQQEVLNFIIDFSDKNLYPPTVREIATHFNFAIKAAQDHLSALQKKGYITNEKNLSRSISVVRDFKINPYAPFVLKIPILAKEINHKFSVFSQENIDAYFMISEPFIEKNKNYFLFALNENDDKNDETSEAKTETDEKKSQKSQKFALIEKLENKISDSDFKNFIQKNEIFIYQNKNFVIGKICNENLDDLKNLQKYEKSQNSQSQISILSSNGEKFTLPKLSKKDVLGIVKLIISKY